MLTRPRLPADKVCEKLKKKDSQICELEYGMSPLPLFPFDQPSHTSDPLWWRASVEEQVDLKTVDLDKQKVKTLKKILLESYGDPCKGCVEKEDYIRKIKAFQAERGEL